MLLIYNLDFTYAGRRETRWLFSWTVLERADNSCGRVKGGGEDGTWDKQVDS